PGQMVPLTSQCSGTFAVAVVITADSIFTSGPKLVAGTSAHFTTGPASASPGPKMARSAEFFIRVHGITIRLLKWRRTLCLLEATNLSKEYPSPQGPIQI